MTDKPKKFGGELFILDNADDKWKVQRYRTIGETLPAPSKPRGVGRLSRLNSSALLTHREGKD
jgi:hypothetical protein